MAKRVQTLMGNSVLPPDNLDKSHLEARGLSRSRYWNWVEGAPEEWIC